MPDSTRYHFPCYAQIENAERAGLSTKERFSGFSFLILLLSLITLNSRACTCPSTSLSLQECEKYEIIFRGKVLRSLDCGSRPGEAIFEVLELYKGNSRKEFKVLFNCTGECAKKFSAGEEWIIYSNYRQVDNAMMDWCSRSRKMFRNDNEDYYLVLYGNDYDDELAFLRKNLGVHRLLKDNPAATGRNERPDLMQSAIILLCSLAALLLFYFLFNRYFR